MRIILFIILLASCATTYQLTSDTFKRYSYNIYGGMLVINTQNLDTISNYFSGTVFFLRKNGSLFLITARHVLSSCDDKLIKNSLYPDSLFVIIPTKYGLRFLTVDISVIRDTARCLPFYIVPDIIVLKINDTLEKYVHSVENFIAPLFKESKNAFAIGYPIAKNMEDLRYHFIAPSVIDFSKYTSAFVEGIYRDSTHLNLDSINYYWVSSENKMKNQGGISGSPFFVQDLKSGKWRIAGVLSGIFENLKDTSKSFVVIPKIEFALNDIQSRNN